MIAHSQPIALPAAQTSDYAMGDAGSYTGSSSGTFNPASFTRHFLGSPISWRTGSYGLTSRSPAVFSKSIENDGELCRNYSCCGLHLTDLHALLEHFEQVHIVVLDPTSSQPQAHIQIPFNPTIHDLAGQPSHAVLPSQEQLQQHVQNQLLLQRQQQLQQQQQQQYASPFDPEDMELDIDLDNHPQPPPPSRQSSTRSSPSSCAPSPPDTPISTPLSAYPSPRHHALPHYASPYISQPPSPLASTYAPSTAASTRQNSPTGFNLTLAPGTGFPRATPAPQTHLANPEEAFNTYARFASDYSSCMPGAQFNGATVDEASRALGVAGDEFGMWQQAMQHEQEQRGVPPALLFGASKGPLRPPSPPRAPSGIAKAHSTPHIGGPHPLAHPPAPPPPPPTPSTPHPIVRPQSTLLLSKPFRCPKPNCNKSYKQANGLKYHMTHGSCNFAPPKDLEHVKDLLERKRREREANANASPKSSSGLTRSASLGSAPLTVNTSPTGAPVPSSSTTSPIATPSTSSAHTPYHSNTPEPGTPLSPTSILGLTYSDLSNISSDDLLSVEREAERRLRPFACGVGECTRRYKNMNGLRYHYQHSGEHGSVGLGLLASGQHECLSVRRGGGGGGGNSNMGVQRTMMVQHQQTTKGSTSVPVSRAGSTSVSRVGTPQPQTPASALSNLSMSRTHTPAGSTHTSPDGSPLGSPLHQTQGVHQQVAQQVVQQQVAQYQQQQQQYTLSHQQQQQQMAAYHYAQQIQRQYHAQVQAAQAQAVAAQVQQEPKVPSPQLFTSYPSIDMTNPPAMDGLAGLGGPISSGAAGGLGSALGGVSIGMDAAHAAAMYARQQHAQNSELS